ncbi:DUF536 domain-containing protein [Staphylococcus xylosus]|uniref:DUF536 domain-containing protein n=1 Tax=Staphylococcus xylosus TaxID=1288 RepID=UPI001C3D49CC|nr:DUF536 domain-containing protein [Staphylococcus xylosus]MBV5141336.1 DUF536 domain-containing protein [Staphylococcus xylosus]MBW3126245.1 DUF536 domain-containing protein [Staphylococcus xylosus]
MKTIKMVADELNVTKQTIVNNAKNLNVSFKKENGVNYINNDDYLRIIEKITKKENTIENRETVKKEDFNKKYPEVEHTVYSNIDSSDTLKTKVNELEKQIEIFETRAKNDEKYIGSLTKQLDQQNSNVNTLNKLLENQQILALESNKKIQKLEHQLEEERHLNYSFDTSTNDRQNVDAQEATYATDPVNINQHQEETKEAEIQYKDISESQSDGSIQGEEAQREDVPSNQNDNDSDIEEKSEETQPKKGFWSRLFGG